MRQRYATLADAVKAVEKGTTATPTTITLLKKQNISSLMVGHQYAQNIIVDLNGYTLSSSAIVLTAYRSGTTLEVKNGTISGNSTSGTLRATYGGKLVLKQSTNVNNKVNVTASVGRTYFGSLADAIEFAKAGDTVTLIRDINLTAKDLGKKYDGYNTFFNISGKSITIDLNGKTIYGENTRTNTHNFLIDVNGGTLTASNGTIAMKHTGSNMGWNGATTVIDVTANGTLNLNGVTVQNQGGTDMNFAVHMNNWGEVTLNADNCVFDALYCGVRVFNSGYDMNNVKLTNSKLTGSTRAFWVHNYLGDLDSSKHSDEAIKARLNLDIYGNNNTFEITGTAKAPIRYGFGDTVYFNAEGSRVVDTAEELQDAINNGSADITLDGDIDLG